MFCGILLRFQHCKYMLPQESKEALFLDLLKLPKRNFDLISMPSGLRRKGSNLKTNYGDFIMKSTAEIV